MRGHGKNEKHYISTIKGAYDHKTQGSDIYQGAPTHKFPKLLNEVFMNEVFMDIRLGKMLIYSTVRTSYPKGYVTF